MPTVSARIQVTATAEVARSLKIAEQEWPGIPRSEQLARLAALGAREVESARAARRAQRRDALEQTRGVLVGAYQPGLLEELRKDWPE